MTITFQTLNEIRAGDRQAKRNYRDIVNLSSNEISHPIHQELVERWRATLDYNQISQYPYYTAIQERLAEQLGKTPMEVLLTAGADEGARILAFALGRAYKKVIAAGMVYSGFSRYSGLAGVTFQQLDLSLSKTIHQTDPALVILTDPDPVRGEKLSPAERLGWSRVSDEDSHLLFVDEAYIGFDGSSPFEKTDPTPSLRTFSKSLGMAGLRLAALIVPPALGDYLARWVPSNTVSASALSYLSFALDHSEDFSEMRADIAKIRERLKVRASHELVRWKVSRSCANFLALEMTSADEASFVSAGLLNKGIVVKTFVPTECDPRILRLTIKEEQAMDRVFDTLSILHSAWRNG